MPVLPDPHATSFCAAARLKHTKLLTRERVEQLCDPDTPFLEFNPLAASIPVKLPSAKQEPHTFSASA